MPEECWLYQDNSHKTLTAVIYALHAASFLFGITGFVAVIINYVKRSDIAGTWLESHFKWQIRTFWYGLLWSIIGTLSFYFVIGIPILMITALWYVYRIAKGWLRLNDHKEMYVSS